jgi:hypothetical protein
MSDDIFLLQDPCIAAPDEAFEERLRASLCAPIHQTPGDFGLDQIWLALDVERRAQRRALIRRRLLRWFLTAKRSVAGWMEAGRLT